MKAQDKEPARALLGTLLEQGKMQTMLEIYERLEPDASSVIRSFMAPTTETGRCRHSESFLAPSTNLANLPNKTAQLDALFKVRDTIVPHEGRLLGKADFSRAEARWCAWMAGDRQRIKLYEDGVDEYKWFVAMMKWEDASRWQEVGKQERNAIGKVGVLSGQYGVGYKTLMDGVNGDYGLHGVIIDVKTAKRMEAIVPELWPDTVQWHKAVAEQVLTHGYIITPQGRRRDFFGRTDTESARKAVVREAIACGPQSANADAIRDAILLLFERGHDTGDDSGLLRFLLQVHDEIVFDCAPKDMRKAALAVKRAMEDAIPAEVNGRRFWVPSEVEMSSTAWSQTRKVA
jgi:DNA polymerase-1